MSTLATPHSSGQVLREQRLGVPASATMVVAVMLTAGFVAGHALFIPATTDGIDSVNFTLALDSYDPARHQPHAPGFPVHVALGRVVNQAYRTVAPTSHDSDTAAASLRVLSVLAGALAILSLTCIATALGTSPRLALLVAALVAMCPLFWITAMRPLSDVPGLCFALVSQALALAAINRRAEPTTVNYRLLAAGVIAGLAVGVRVQTTLLTVPLIALVTFIEIRRGRPAAVWQVALSVATGIVAWALPLLSAVGGLDDYIRLLTAVAADDIEGVAMLATHMSPRLLALAVVRTFLTPWNSVVLGTCMLVLAAVGAIVLARHDRRALGLIAVMGAPYLVFHLLFQETESIRYALPLIPVLCLLVASCIASGSRHMVVAIVAMLLVSAALSVTAASAYGSTQSPAARASYDVRHAAATRQRPPTLAFHHAVGRAIRNETWAGTALPGQPRYEWLELGRYWLDGGREPVWFLSDDRRTELALIDPRARRGVRSYRWPENVAPLLGGAQPLAVSWHEIEPPGWFLMRGWGLTAEANGVSRRDGRTPGTTGATGYIRRRGGAAVMMIGGRNTGALSDAGAVVQVAIDGRPRGAWVVSPHSAFLERIGLAPGDLRGESPYAEVEITAWDVAGTARRVDVAIEHFDVQSAGTPMAGIGPGWHIPEVNHDTGVTWRWTDERAEMRVEPFGHDVELVIRGESPLRYFRNGSNVVIYAEDRKVASRMLDADFEWAIPISAATLAASGGRMAIESDQWFIPDEVSGNGDRRRLALRIYDVRVRLR